MQAGIRGRNLAFGLGEEKRNGNIIAASACGEVLYSSNGGGFDAFIE